jgi:hypothetical protein
MNERRLNFQIGHTNKGVWISLGNERVNISVEDAFRISQTLEHQAQQAVKRLKGSVHIIRPAPRRKVNWQNRIYSK